MYFVCTTQIVAPARKRLPLLFAYFRDTTLALLKVVRSVLPFPLDVASHAGLLVGGNRASAQHRFQRRAQVRSGYGTSVAGTAVIELSAINEPLAAIENIKIGRARGAIGFGHLLRFVVEIGER